MSSSSDGQPIRAFISHGSADRERFTRGFAERLRAEGIDAWYDEWELQPGDSLVDRIFNEGLGQADVFVVVLSPDSVERDWVRAELNAAVVKQIERACRLIPVILDGATVPEALRSTVWQAITDTSSYDAEFDRIVRSIYGSSDRPSLGQPPAYAAGTPTRIEDLPAAASAVLVELGDEAMRSQREFFGAPAFFGEARERLDMSEKGFHKEMVRLDRGGYVSAEFHGERVMHLRLTAFGLLSYLTASGVDVDQAYIRLVSSLVNTDIRSLPELSEAIDQPYIVVDALFHVLEAKGSIRVSRGMGGHQNTDVFAVDPLLEDELDG